MDNHYTFSAIRGVQAGRAFYIVMIRLKLLGALFSVAKPGWGARERPSRRVSAIARYLIEPPLEYLLPPLTITVAGDMRFEPSSSELQSVGLLSLDLGSNLNLADGKQRVAGICKAICARPFLGEETIAAIILAEVDDTHPERLCRDLNQLGSHSRLACAR